MRRIIREVQPRWVVGENVLGLVNWNGGLVFEEVQADLEAEGYEVQPFILPAASVGNCPHKRDRVWFVAYRTTALTQNPDCDGRRGNEWQEKPCEWEQRNTCSRNNEWLQTNNGKAGPAPDTNHNGYATTKNGQGLGEGNDRNKAGQNYAIEFEGRSVSDGVAPDTESRGQGMLRNEGEATGTRQSNKPLRSVCGIPNWENFPTQSPLCSRTNGISTELDGITFPKWRNESIKAAGNAIVPQVVFQIFKAINEYREKYP
jgi:DNA (cytosine-5)-methyltransferase 1